MSADCRQGHYPPADLQRLHQSLLNSAVIEVISDEMREVVEAASPEPSPRSAMRTVCVERPERREFAFRNRRLMDELP